MRRIFLGISILGLGTLFALPFRKSGGDSAANLNQETPHQKSRSRTAMDLEEIDLLVREVTDGVEIPVLYQAHTDHSADAPPKRINTVPLKYEDVAVPMDTDPFYAQRFNATAAVRHGMNISASSPGGDPFQAARVEKRRMRFANKRPQGSLVRRSETAPLRPPVRLGTGTPLVDSEGLPSPKTPAQLASSAAERGTRLNGAERGTRLKADKRETQQNEVERNTQRNAAGPEVNVELPSGHSDGDRSVLSQLPVLDATDANRRPQWIRQPD